MALLSGLSARPVAATRAAFARWPRVALTHALPRALTPLAALPARALAADALADRELPVAAATRRGESTARRPGSGFTLQVFTGDRRGASTNANVSVSLVGSLAEAGPYHLVGDFKRATMQSFYVESERAIGSLQRVRIGHDATDVGSGWFVDKVVVESHANGQIAAFPCERWLGESDSGGASGPCVQELEEESEALELAVSSLRRGAKPQALSLVSAAGLLPRSDKLRAGKRGRIGGRVGWGGEDAYFCAKARDGRRQWVLGVADGVGSWEESGIDAGLYSRSLVEYALACFDEGTPDSLATAAQPEEDIAPLLVRVVQAAADKTRADNVQGSSTLCVVHLDGDHAQLTSANIGDSGFLIIRDGVIVYRSAQQEHSFGCPYQLGHHATSALPTDAQISKLPAEPGDAIVLGTDGLFDNLSDAEIVDGVKHAASAGGSVRCSCARGLRRRKARRRA